MPGTGDEGLRDGAPHEAFFAQPSGLAADRAGTLWVADAESSALRAVVAAPRAGAAVTTVVGQGLFDFGLRDGPGLGSAERPPALLQHPTGVAVLPDGSIAVADTYNGAVRRYDPASREVATLAEGLDEPTDVGLDGGTVRVVESAAHRLVRLPLPARVLTDAPAGPKAIRATLAGSVALRVLFTPPNGQGLDDRFGEPTSLSVAASPAELLVDGGGTAPGLQRSLRLAGPGVAMLHVEMLAAACDHTDSGETSIFAACHVYRHAWEVAVTVATDGASMLDLPLRPVG